MPTGSSVAGKAAHGQVVGDEQEEGPDDRRAGQDAAVIRADDAADHVRRDEADEPDDARERHGHRRGEGGEQDQPSADPGRIDPEALGDLGSELQDVQLAPEQGEQRADGEHAAEGDADPGPGGASQPPEEPEVHLKAPGGVQQQRDREEGGEQARERHPHEQQALDGPAEDAGGEQDRHPREQRSEEREQRQREVRVGGAELEDEQHGRARAYPRERPRRYGSASGLRKVPCSVAPLRPSAAPTTSASMTAGMRLSQTISTQALQSAGLAELPAQGLGASAPPDTWWRTIARTVAGGMLTEPSSGESRTTTRAPTPTAQRRARDRRPARPRGASSSEGTGPRAAPAARTAPYPGWSRARRVGSPSRIIVGSGSVSRLELTGQACPSETAEKLDQNGAAA